MTARHALLCALLLTPLLPATCATATEAACPAPAAAALPDCDELEDCVIAGLELDDNQQQQARSLLEAARKRQDALRDDTMRQLAGLLTPAQGRVLDSHRSGILRDRAQRLQRQAACMAERARHLRQPR